jgi:hypothetical protein
MRYTVTARTEKLVADLARLAEAAENRLALASAAAQREWKAVRFQWPSEVDLRTGVIELSDDELERMRSKVRRFVSILESVGSTTLRDCFGEAPTPPPAPGASG